MSSAEARESSVKAKVERLLDDGDSRAALLEETFAHPPFMDAYLAQVATDPDLRKGAQDKLRNPRGAEQGHGSQSDQVVYSFVMLPDVRSDKPRSCPKCGMRLERVSKDRVVHPNRRLERSIGKLLDDRRNRDVVIATLLEDREFTADWIAAVAANPEWRDAALERFSDSSGSKERSVRNASAIYSCPMHPEVRSDHPGNCPKCGMALKRVRA